MEEEALVELHRDLVQAAVSVEKLELSGEDDLLVLFPADLMSYGLGRELLVEYDDPAVDWQRGGELDELASKLGNAVKRHVPSAVYIQCRVNSRKGGHYWSSTISATREEVERIQEVVLRLTPIFEQIASRKCYCEANSVDFKGPCGHHMDLGAYKQLAKKGEQVLGTTDAAEFQALADVYVKDARSAYHYLELHYELGWAQRPESRQPLAA